MAEALQGPSSVQNPGILVSQDPSFSLRQTSAPWGMTRTLS